MYMIHSRSYSFLFTLIIIHYNYFYFIDLFMTRHEVHSMNTHTLQNAGRYKNRQNRT